uniref:transposase n=1 Tax=Virgibacillus pantothenticus TaxID=1473 RepID=UPI0035714F81
GERFQTVIADVENKEIIDILPDRKVDTIKEYLQSRDTSKVQIVVMDLSKSFKQAVQKALGNPLIIADRFHYMRQVYWDWMKYAEKFRGIWIKSHVSR